MMFIADASMHYSSILLKLSFKLSVINWENVGSWEKVILIRKAFKHLHQANSKLFFVRNHTNSRKLRYSLVWF